jgi:hypothetical protein
MYVIIMIASASHHTEMETMASLFRGIIDGCRDRWFSLIPAVAIVVVLEGI